MTNFLQNRNTPHKPAGSLQNPNPNPQPLQQPLQESMNVTMYAHSNPIPHRKHKKSRGGCKACKLRKVKCDEKHPVCSKCQVHFSNIKACDYGQNIGSVAKKSLLPGTSHEVKRVLRPAAIAPPSNEKLPSSLQTTEDSHLRTSLRPAHLHIGKAGITPPPDNSLSPKVSLGRACGCPCHKPEYTVMLLDGVFGVCRICGNMPSLNVSPSTCLPVVPEAVLMSGRIDPFGVLPSKQSPRVHTLVYHWVNTLSLFPTLIHSEYCTNKSWLTTAMANPALFNATLFVSSVHLDGLHGRRESSESLYYKFETIRVLNEALQDPEMAVADETISAVLLLGNIISIIGEPGEVDAHLKGLQEMVNLRGGIQSFAFDGVFLHMLCTTNHLSAVLSESAPLHPPTGIAYKPHLSLSSSAPLSPCSSTSSLQSKLPSLASALQELPLLKSFAVKIGFDSTLVDVFHDLGYLYATVDAFTHRLLPSLREGFEDVVAREMGGLSSGVEGGNGEALLMPRHVLA